MDLKLVVCIIQDGSVIQSHAWGRRIEHVDVILASILLSVQDIDVDRHNLVTIRIRCLARNRRGYADGRSHDLECVGPGLKIAAKLVCCTGVLDEGYCVNGGLEIACRVEVANCIIAEIHGRRGIQRR